MLLLMLAFGHSVWWNSTSPTSAAPTTLQTTAAAAAVPTTSSATATTGSGNSGIGPGATLQRGYYWIRAIESPNFHKYLKPSPLYSPGPAVMGDLTTAGKFQAVNGQSVQLASETGATTQLLGIFFPEFVQLYFSRPPRTHTTRSAGQGDGQMWSTPDIARPNQIAWYACTGQLLYINLGNYDYHMPVGCADETTHYYNAATASSYKLGGWRVEGEGLRERIKA
ncbi:hypothetical protein K432DRAFT_399969 [Lepidopterella palustris CBS 459.81]|uniref:Uncharacterized protein n=1 Tax=Lepidopterella palustris CBS 459.81 TaxID=1314670 RepID=A0A8E2EKK0_9PEZI|nr:hypothetical protein K432DRAFT_399969 [Lepidopterella palustris CBS 459.81]